MPPLELAVIVGLADLRKKRLAVIGKIVAAQAE
jgi:hypothetical protein